MLPRHWAFDHHEYEWRNTKTGWIVYPHENVSGAWIAESPTGITTLCTSWNAAIRHADKHTRPSRLDRLREWVSA